MNQRVLQTLTITLILFYFSSAGEAIEVQKLATDSFYIQEQYPEISFQKIIQLFYYEQYQSEWNSIIFFENLFSNLPNINYLVESCELQMLLLSSQINVPINMTINQVDPGQSDTTKKSWKFWNKAVSVNRNLFNKTIQFNSTYPQEGTWMNISITDICKNMKLQDSYRLHLSLDNSQCFTKGCIPKYIQIIIQGFDTNTPVLSPRLIWNLQPYDANSLWCGDGIISKERGEECDLGGNNTNGTCCKNCSLINDTNALQPCFCNSEPSQCRCKVGAFKTSDGSCTQCFYGCSECSGPSSYECLKCSSGRQFSTNLGKYCQLCHPSCLECTNKSLLDSTSCLGCKDYYANESDCTICKQGYSKTQNGKCTAICEPPFKYNEDDDECICAAEIQQFKENNKSCKDCHPSCYGCTDSGPTHCKFCDDPEANPKDCSQCLTGYEKIYSANQTFSCQVIQNSSSYKDYIFMILLSVTVLLAIAYYCLRKKLKNNKFLNIGKNKYKKLQKLTVGGFGAIYLVEDIKSKIQYVLKEQDISYADDANGQKKYTQSMMEVRNYQKLLHENIIKMIDHSIDNGLLLIVLEYADRGDLHEYIKSFKNKDTQSIEDEDEKDEKKLENIIEHRKSMSENSDLKIEILNIFLQICKGVYYMHFRGFIHRDLKPQNIFLKSVLSSDDKDETVVKLGDFGTTKNLENTQAHTKIGTFMYASPEFFEYQQVDLSYDVWSITVILYKMLTLKLPFHNIDQIKKIRYNTNLINDQDLLQLIQRVFQENPDERPLIKEVMYTVVKKLQSLGQNLDFEQIITEIDQIEEIEVEPLTERSLTTNNQPDISSNTRNTTENNYITFVELEEIDDQTLQMDIRK